MEILIVIPARLASTRLPNKMLLSETGKPVIQHTYEAAQRSKLAQSVLVATDDARLLDAVEAFGGHVCLTGAHHQSGTDRLAEVALSRPEVEMFVNVQGDEPEIDPRDIDRVIERLQQSPAAHMATLATPIRSEARLRDPACVKVVMDREQRALYFSRSPIPYPHEPLPGLLDDAAPRYYQHIGLYAYRREWLLEFARLPRSSYEEAESLEQLRALQAGKTILVEITDREVHGIDTRDDYDAFVSKQRN